MTVFFFFFFFFHRPSYIDKYIKIHIKLLMELVDKRPKDWTSQKSPKYTLKKTTLLVNKTNIKIIISHWHQLENYCELGQFDHYINSLQNRSVDSPYVFPYSIWPNTLIHQENGINNEAAICVYVQNLCRKIAASLLIAYSRGIKMIRCLFYLLHCRCNYVWYRWGILFLHILWHWNGILWLCDISYNEKNVLYVPD